MRDSGKAKAEEIDPSKDSFRELFEDFLISDAKNEMKEHLPPDVSLHGNSTES